MTTHASPPGHLLLVRHGETLWSRDRRHTGLTDLPLLPEGEAVAARLPALLERYDVVAARVSPAQRARRTAELAGLGDLAVVDDRLHEWDYGGYEGLTTPQIREQVGHDWTVFADGVVPGDTPGETLEQVADRARAVLADVAADRERGDVALVAHSHLLRVLAAVALQEDPHLGAKLVLDAGALSVLGEEHGLPVVRAWNLTP
ncbi:histidine phosphatase family protein [Lapillicoccus jejuensis]|uniref:Putative phosphoglycerate mutase n=1 Tax=Lapillicoccus jejuensis TaxID=402171 RepID=A0A542E569_9MICO|nr:histidine phosphatase family protein [Lapillicoccus jejuensis]TQJ10419.1 putative phosphoglycerate mutase [Lapillicoccus jejuensis]